jgi:hypothetical protein
MNGPREARAGYMPPDFVDHFEGTSLDPFWSTTAISGSIIFPSTGQAHGGLQSVQFNSTATTNDKYIDLHHDFSSSTFGSFSVWVYDTGAGQFSSNYLSMYLYNFGLKANVGILTFDYDLGPGQSGHDYYVANPNGIDIGVARTQGWHQFSIDLTPNSENFLIDGHNVYSSQQSMEVDRVALIMFGPYWRPAWTVYYDDFEYKPYGQNASSAVPEPASLTLLGLGSLSLLGYGWRRRKAVA